MIRGEIKKIIKKAVEGLGFKIPKISVEHNKFPKNEYQGDYSTNILLEMAKIAKKRPMEMAKDFMIKLHRFPEAKLKFDMSETGPVKPGFINFFLSKEYLQKQVGEILKQGEKFGNLKIGKNKKIQVEFISANPTGPLTIGNASAGPFGDVLANVLEKAGYKVTREYYINDVGEQIKKLGHSVLGDAGAVYKGVYIDELRKKVLGGRVSRYSAEKVGEEAAKIILEEMIKKTIKRMGIEYDEWFSEKNLHKSKAVDKTVGLLKKKGLTYEKDGALWFKSTSFGDSRDRVLVKKDGRKTYLASDIAYHEYKFKKKKFDKAINIWGADHYGDAPGLKAGVEALGFNDKIDFVILQFVTLLERGEKIRMSKRKGVYVAMDQLLDEIPLDVVRFFFLARAAGSHLNFDLALAKEKSEKNPVYYVQYAHARINSILRKTKNQKPKTKNYKLLSHKSELNLIKELSRFPEIVEDTAKDYQVQRIPQYAVDLATAFHQFYRDCRVIGEDKKLSRVRLALVLTTKTVLENVLDLMGISAPEKM